MREWVALRLPMQLSKANLYEIKKAIRKDRLFFLRDLSSFDLNVHASRDRKNFQLVDSVWCWIQQVEHADVCAHFELLARLAVDVRGSENGEDLAFCWKWDRPHNAGTGPFRRFDNVLYGTVEHPLIKCFEADPYSFSGLFCHIPTS